MYNNHTLCRWQCYNISLHHTQNPSTQLSHCEVLFSITVLLGTLTSGSDNVIIIENSMRMIV